MSSILSSEILEKQFGLTRLKILKQDDWFRIITTEIVSSGEVLEISQVQFLSVPEELNAIHQQVVAGTSMGKAFKDAEMMFSRITSGTWKTEVPTEFQKIFNSDTNATVVKVIIQIGEKKIPYAQITETYSPAVKWPTKASTILPQEVKLQLNKIAQRIS